MLFNCNFRFLPSAKVLVCQIQKVYSVQLKGFRLSLSNAKGLDVVCPMQRV